MSSSASGCSSSWAAANADFEVAKVLASLGKRAAEAEHSVGGGGGNTDESMGCNIWGNKGKRIGKRVMTESELDEPAAHPSGSVTNSVPLPFDLNTVDHAATYDQEEGDNRSEDGNIKLEEVCVSAEPGPVSNGPHNGGRSRQNLTESEKEARRIRRILANRESARQTIRRRQALYEELTRKAADLASENQNLKKSKELVVEEFQSLQSTNLNLKNQVSQTLGFSLRENRGEVIASSSDANDYNVVSANWPFLICNKFSANSFIWQPSPDVNLFQLNQHNITTLPKPNVPTHYEEEKSLNINGQNIPLCVITCPWFLPLSNNMKNNDSILHLSSLHLKDKTEEPFLYVLSPTSILKAEAHTPKQGKSKNVVLNLEAPLGIYSNPLSEQHEIKHVVELSKKKADATTGVDARKRRRELMKLKSIHCHPTRGGYG